MAAISRILWITLAQGEEFFFIPSDTTAGEPCMLHADADLEPDMAGWKCISPGIFLRTLMAEDHGLRVSMRKRS